jgi:tetratricopeptide (TPR) repeat protein
MQSVGPAFGLGALLAAILTLFVAVPVRADDPPELQVCLDEARENRLRIDACTDVLANGSTTVEARTDALVARGLLYDDEEEYDKAIADYTEALKLTPNDGATLVLRGNSYDANGAPALAIADYTAAIKLNPDDSSAYFNRATVYEDMGETDKAIADYTKALEIDPDYTEAREALEELKKK